MNNIIMPRTRHWSSARMGLIRLRVRELAAEKGWTLKEVSEGQELLTAQSEAMPIPRS